MAKAKRKAPPRSFMEAEARDRERRRARREKRDRLHRELDRLPKGDHDGD